MKQILRLGLYLPDMVSSYNRKILDSKCTSNINAFIVFRLFFETQMFSLALTALTLLDVAAYTEGERLLTLALSRCLALPV